MKHWVAAFIFISVACTGAFAAGKGPEINLTDNKLSITADAISLSRLLQLVDMATGMKSKVPADLANRRISVRFSGLSLQDVVRKIFQGQPYDYVMIEGQGVIVTAASQSASGSDSPPPFNPQPAMQNLDQPFTQEFPPAPGGQFPPFQQQLQPMQPATVPTPFGPIPNPRAQQPAVVPQQPQQPQPTNVFGTPPQNSLFPQAGQPIPGDNNNGQQPAIPLIQPGIPPQFGGQTPFGFANPPAMNPNGVFGTPPVSNTPGNVQR
jgi:hypothetical protein